MADIKLRPPLETKPLDANGEWTQPWRQFLGSFRDKIDKALSRLEVAVDAEIVDLNITGEFFMDDVKLIDEFRSLLGIKDIDAEDITAETLTTTGAITVGGAANITGDISGADIDGDAITGDSLSVTGEVAGGTLDIGGDADIGGDLDVTGDVGGATLDISGNADVGGDIDVTGDVGGATATITGNATVGGTLGVASDLTVKGAEDTDAIFNLWADKGDDNADKWRIRISKTANIAYFETYVSGSWVAKWTVDASGDFTVANDIILPADNDKTYYGTGKDASVYYDGTDMNIKTDEVAASDLIVSCGTDKTIELSEPVWDDLRVPMQNTKINPTKSEPNFENFADGLYAYAFDAGNNDDESLHFMAQLPHGYKEGTDIEPHIHWMPSTTNTGNVVWELEYAWVNIDGTMPSSASPTVTDAADGTALKHQYTEFAHIDGTGKTISSMLACRLTRLGDDAADTFTGIAYALEFDFHYQIDTLGSRQALVK